MPTTPPITATPAAGGRPKWLLFAALGVAVAVVAGVFVLGGGDEKGESNAAPSEVFLEPLSSVGPDPFTESVAKTAPTTTTAPKPTTAPTTAPASIAVASVQGTAPGLYAGMRRQPSCDRPRLVALLQQDATKTAAWAKAQGVAPAGVGEYVGRLTSVFLQRDTRVTLEGFAGGTTVPRQSVLQIGTAVLVDNQGVPRVRCTSGSPLAPPQPAPPKFSGPPWAGFDPTQLQAITPGPATDRIVFRDVTSGEAVTRPAGTDGTIDVPGQVTGDLPTTTTTTATTTTAAGTVQAGTNIAATGTAQPSSGDGALALDGDPATSWMADVGADGDNSLFVWSAPGQATISAVTIVGNGANTDETLRTGHGFESVTVNVIDGTGNQVFTQTVSLAGSPDPTVTVTPNVAGANVALLFTGHEASDRAGFAELEVTLSG